MSNPNILIAYPVLKESESDRFCIDLRVLGYETFLVTNASGLEKAIAMGRYRAIIIGRGIKDPARNGGDGYAIASRIKRARLATPVIVLDADHKNEQDRMSDTGVYVIPDTVIHLECMLAELFYPERIALLR